MLGLGVGRIKSLFLSCNLFSSTEVFMHVSVAAGVTFNPEATNNVNTHRFVI